MPDEPLNALSAAILDQAADAIIFADRDGCIQLWNAAAVRMFGFTPEQALGRSLDIIIPEHLRARHWAGYRMAMESGVTKYSGRPMRTKGLHQSGESLYAEMSFGVVRDAKLGVLGAVAIARESPAKPKAG